MINIQTIASGSNANCYIIDTGKEKIMIECGIPLKKLRKEWRLKVHEISACLISHEH